jgi:hypothetical protein
MTPVLAAELPPVDACPSPDCHPGLSGPCLPQSWAVLPSGCTLAGYWHEACGMAWATKFDEHLWPIDRSIAPAEPTRRAA